VGISSEEDHYQTARGKENKHIPWVAGGLGRKGTSTPCKKAQGARENENGKKGGEKGKFFWPTPLQKKENSPSVPYSKALLGREIGNKHGEKGISIQGRGGKSRGRGGRVAAQQGTNSSLGSNGGRSITKGQNKKKVRCQEVG